MTGYGINGFFAEKLGITASPSMIYACLSGVERKGWIKCIRNRNGRTYSLTEKGQEIVNNLPAIAEQIHLSVRTLLKT
jgi:DNA-binding PadR family transcriptional regulator